MAKRSSEWGGESEWGSLIPPEKKQRKPENPLTTLPDDILVHISSLVAADEYHSHSSFILRRVCKAFNRFGQESYVLRALSDSVVRRLNWSRDPQMYVTFQKCLDSENPEAMYYQGLSDYFNRDDRTSGKRYLIAAANAGLEKAKYAWGMILFCLGGEDKAKGLDMLRSLMAPIVSRSMLVMSDYRVDMGMSIWTHGNKGSGVAEMKQNYVRDNCGCNGHTTAFMEMDMWERDRTGMEINSPEACHICFFDREVRLLLGDD